MELAFHRLNVFQVMALLIKMKTYFFHLSVIVTLLFFGCVKSNARITKFENGEIETVQIIQKETNTVCNYIFDTKGDITHFSKTFFDSSFSICVGYKDGIITDMAISDTNCSNPQLMIIYHNNIQKYKRVAILNHNSQNGQYYDFDSFENIISAHCMRKGKLLAVAKYKSGNTVPNSYEGDSLLIIPFVKFNSDSAKKIESLIGGKINKIMKVKDLKFRVVLEESE